MTFEDFKIRDLPGKHVLWISGNPSRRTKEVKKITRVIKSGFYIDGQPSLVFSYHTGEQIAGKNRSRCELIADISVDRVKQEIESSNYKEGLIQQIIDNKHKIGNISLESLVEFVSKINPDITAITSPVSPTVQETLPSIDTKTGIEILNEIREIKQKIKDSTSHLLQLEIKIKQIQKNG